MQCNATYHYLLRTSYLYRLHAAGTIPDESSQPWRTPWRVLRPYCEVCIGTSLRRREKHGRSA